MRLLINIIFISILCLIAELFFPWWTISIVAFVVCLFNSRKGDKSFLAGFLGIFLLWFIAALIIDIGNASLLSKKICALFGLPQISLLLIFITAIVGGLVGGLSGLTGFYLRILISKTRNI